MDNISILLKELESYFERLEDLLLKIAYFKKMRDNIKEKHIKAYYDREIQEELTKILKLNDDMLKFYEELQNRG